jgi:hypothetical protein
MQENSQILRNIGISVLGFLLAAHCIVKSKLSAIIELLYSVLTTTLNRQ